jgi:hypothetical protein
MLRAIESWDAYPNTAAMLARRGHLQWTSAGSNPTSVGGLIAGRYWGNALNIQYDDSPAGTLANNYVQGYWGFDVNYGGGAATFSIAESTNNTVKVAITLNTDGSISHPFGRTPANTLPQNDWFFFEIGITISATAGVLIIRCNEQDVVNESGVNTNGGNTSNVFFNQITTALNPNTSCAIDNLYFTDATGAAPYNGFLGVKGVYARRVSAAGSIAQFTSSSGNPNYENLVGNPGTVYNGSDTVGQTDRFLFGPLPSNVTSVYGIQLTGVYALQGIVGHTIQQSIESGGTVENGTSFLSPYALSQNEFYFTDDPIVYDPSTGLQFTLSAMTALQAGYTLTS